MTTNQPLLQATGLSKHFAGTQALEDVSLSVEHGEIHALLGQNGAGKSTLIKILAGIYQADSGEIRLSGRVVNPAAEKLPISFIHQDLGLFPAMTVAENVAIAVGYPRSGALISWKGARRAAAEALATMGSHVDPDTPVSDLQAAERSMVSIARALAVRADILVLDEPTSSLPEPDVKRLIEALRRLRSQRIGVIYVTHRLDEVFRVADRVTVLRDGRRVAAVPIAETSPSDLVAKIVGRELAAAEATAPLSSTADSVLELEGLTVDGVGPVSFAVGKGESVGLVGLRGAGHAAVGRAIFGDAAVSSGEIRLNAKTIKPRSPHDAIAHGIGLVPGKRLEEATISEMSVRENLYLNPKVSRARKAGWIRPGHERLSALARMRRFTIRPQNPELPLVSLSGGNQQKVILARWMQESTQLLVLEEPTSGVDVGAKAEIYALLTAAQARGAGVLLISSDFEEVERACHRALVFNRGRIVAELVGAEITPTALTHAASGSLKREKAQ
jgi:ribose transport system ATP-binding protein